MCSSSADVQNEIVTFVCARYEWDSSQDVEKCALDLVLSFSTHTNTIQTIALASKGGQKIFPESLLLRRLPMVPFMFRVKD